MLTHIDDNNFNNEVLNHEGVVVVDFYATWCAPCKMLAPVLEELQGELQDGAKIFKVDVDKNPVVSNKYGISSIPTVMIFKDGVQVDKKVGFLPKDTLKEAIEEVL